MRLVIVILVAACGGSKPTPTGPGSGSNTTEPEHHAEDKRTLIEKRRDAGCTALKPKLTACAAADSKARLEAKQISKAEYDAAVDPRVLAKFGEKWMESCQIPMSSRQVRVLEVCFKEESECGPLEDCLTHLNDHTGK
jgi:hypothetical protein